MFFRVFPTAPTMFFPKTATKFNVSLHLHNISYIFHITYMIYNNFVYIPYTICIFYISPISFTSSASSTSTNTTPSTASTSTSSTSHTLHHQHHLRQLHQHHKHQIQKEHIHHRHKLSHRSFVPKLLYSSCYTGVVIQELTSQELTSQELTSR